MDTNNIKTSRDLADLLEYAVKMLRTLPEYELSEGYQQGKHSTIQKKSHGIAEASNTQMSLADLASKLPSLSRESAVSEIESLTLESMRQIASLLEIRIPSRATKSETLNTLLAQLFDIPAGQERIRTFHKRNVQS